MSNSPNFRELENKYLLNISKAALSRLVRQLKAKTEVPTDYVFAHSVDFYWDGKTEAQFLRLRNSWGHDGEGKRTLQELTAKSKDRKTNVNRLEINAPVSELKLLRKALTVALGNPTCRLYKKEHVFWMPDRTVISLCKVRSQWYLEVESNSVARLEKWHRFLCKLPTVFQMTNEPRSLYEIYAK